MKATGQLPVTTVAGCVKLNGPDCASIATSMANGILWRSAMEPGWSALAGAEALLSAGILFAVRAFTCSARMYMADAAMLWPIAPIAITDLFTTITRLPTITIQSFTDGRIAHGYGRCITTGDGMTIHGIRHMGTTSGHIRFIRARLCG